MNFPSIEEMSFLFECVCDKHDLFFFFFFCDV